MSQKISSAKCDPASIDAKRLFDRKLLAYAAAAGAAVVSGQAAQATIATRQINVDVSYGVNSPYSLDVDNDGQNDFNFGNGFAFTGNPFASVSQYPGTDNQVVGFRALSSFLGTSFSKASRLATSNHVSGANSWISYGTLAKTPGFSTSWAGQTGYLGIRFTGGDLEEHYGFVQMSVNPGEPGNPFPIHIDSVAWNTLPTDTVGGEGIHVEPIAAAPSSSVPEPIGLGALALGAAGLASLRRRSA